jgi:hypothetical protein
VNALKAVKGGRINEDLDKVYVVMKSNKIQIFDKRSLNIYDIAKL